MPGPPLRLEEFLPYRLSVLSNVVSSSIAAAYSERFGLSIPEWRVLAVLAVAPEASAAQVAERTAMDKVAVSRAVASLLRSRRIVRRFARADRRRSILRLSRSGWQVYGEVVPLALEYEGRLLELLSARERDSLDRILGTLLERALQLAGPAGPGNGGGR